MQSSYARLQADKQLVSRPDRLKQVKAIVRRVYSDNGSFGWTWTLWKHCSLWQDRQAIVTMLAERGILAEPKGLDSIVIRGLIVR